MSFTLSLSEAKSIHQSLKELLKTKEPFDKEVDFQRKRSVHFFRFCLTLVAYLRMFSKVFGDDT